MTEVISRPTEARATQAIDQWAEAVNLHDQERPLTLEEKITVFKQKRLLAAALNAARRRLTGRP